MSIDPSPIRILTVDDHPLIRVGIATLVAPESDMKVVGEASNGREGIAKFRECLPDVTLMDLQMPDMNGIDVLIAIRDEFPEARIIVLTTYTGDVQVFRALKAGAQAYVTKNLVHKELLPIAAGNANKEIAAQLSISEETVKSRVKNILLKLGANDRTHAVTIALKRGIIEL